MYMLYEKSIYIVGLNMKKMMAIILAGLLCMALSGCGVDGGNGTDSYSKQYQSDSKYRSDINDIAGSDKNDRKNLDSKMQEWADRINNN